MSRVKMRFAKLSVSPFVVLLCLSGMSAQAQMPPNNSTTPNSPGQIAVSSTAPYSTSSPKAKLSVNLTLNSFWAFAPFTGEYLEVSSPNSNTMMVNIASACTRTVGRMLACNIQFPLSTASMAGSSTLVTTRYYAHKIIPTEVGYLKAVTSVSGTAGSIGGASTGGPPPLPTLTSIAPHNLVGASIAVPITSTPTPTTYDANTAPIKVDFTISDAWYGAWSTPSNELIELTSSTGATVPVSVSSACVRSGSTNRTLTCTAYYNLSPSQKAATNTQIEVRYFANGYVGTSAVQLYSQNYMLLPQQITVPVTTNAPVTCTPQNAPMMPTSTDSNGGFVFEIPSSDLCPGLFWIDPPVATGYTYTITGASFASVRAPDVATVPNKSSYRLSTRQGRTVTSTRLSPGQSQDFAVPVHSFDIDGIDPNLSLGVDDPLAFPTGLELVNPKAKTVIITQLPR